MQEIEKGQAACDQFKSEKAELLEEVTQLKNSLKESNVVHRSAEIEVRQAAVTIAGNPYLLQCLLGIHGSAALTQVWHHAETFLDLSLSAAIASKCYQELNDPHHETLQAFWAQFQDASQAQHLS